MKSLRLTVLIVIGLGLGYLVGMASAQISVQYEEEYKIWQNIEELSGAVQRAYGTIGTPKGRLTGLKAELVLGEATQYAAIEKA